MQFVKTVKEYALNNYEQDGWDILIECYADDEIQEVIGNANNSNEAISRLKDHLKTQNDYRSEIMSEVF